MHFWVSATRGGFHGAFCCPRKMGTNWFMPALVKSRLGESGRSEDEGTMVCCFSRKKSRNDWRIWALVRMGRRERRFEKGMRSSPRRGKGKARGGGRRNVQCLSVKKNAAEAGASAA